MVKASELLGIGSGGSGGGSSKFGVVNIPISSNITQGERIFFYEGFGAYSISATSPALTPFDIDNAITLGTSSIFSNLTGIKFSLDGTKLGLLSNGNSFATYNANAPGGFRTSFGLAFISSATIQSGTKMDLVENGTRVYQITGTAITRYNISSFNASTQTNVIADGTVMGGNNIEGIAVAEDGTTIAIGRVGQIECYIMSTPHNLNTRSLVGTITGVGQIREMRYTPDGLKLIVNGAANSYTIYSLSTPYDPTTAVLTQTGTLPISNYNIGSVNSDGSLMTLYKIATGIASSLIDYNINDTSTTNTIDIGNSLESANSGNIIQAVINTGGILPWAGASPGDILYDSGELITTPNASISAARAICVNTDEFITVNTNP